MMVWFEYDLNCCYYLIFNEKNNSILTWYYFQENMIICACANAADMRSSCTCKGGGKLIIIWLEYDLNSCYYLIFKENNTSILTQCCFKQYMIICACAKGAGMRSSCACTF